MDQLPRLGKRELICQLLFTCNYVVSVWRGYLFLWVLGMGYVILLWHSLSLPLIILHKARQDDTSSASKNAAYSNIYKTTKIRLRALQDSWLSKKAEEIQSFADRKDIFLFSLMSLSRLFHS